MIGVNIISSTVANIDGVRVLLDGPGGSYLFDAEVMFWAPLHHSCGRSCMVNIRMISTPAVLSIASPLLHQRFTHTMYVEGVASHLGTAASGSASDSLACSFRKLTCRPFPTTKDDPHSWTSVSRACCHTREHDAMSRQSNYYSYTQVDELPRVV